MYQKIKSMNQNTLKRISDTAFIPEDIDNVDYQQYLAWVAEGNEPEIIDLTQ